MPTLSKKLRKLSLKKKTKKKTILYKHPQLQGICQKVLIKNPKKPNSANRKVAKIKLSSGKEIIAHIPGVGNTLQPHNFVLISGGYVKDLPGVNFKIIRGAKEMSGVLNRKSSRSLYGVKK